MNNPIKITICGDICPTKDTQELFEKGNASALFNNTMTLIQTADIAIGNLEFPLIDNGNAVKKTGPILSGKTSFIKVFKDAGFDLLGLANNHIKDLGEEGVLSSIKTCNDSEISTVGAGSNLQNAKKPYSKEINGVKIGLMAFAEQEFNIAGQDVAGANYLDVYYDFDAIREFKNQVDYLIILYHGGIEYYKYPSPDLQKRCRKMIEAGADLVTCQHSHCIGTIENYQAGDIVYGQGNMLFGYRKNDEDWNKGLMLNLELEKNENKIISKIDLIPITAKQKGIELLSEKDANLVIQQIQQDSRELNNPQKINEMWEEFCSRKTSLYMPLILGFNRLLIHLNRLSGNRLVNLLYSSKRLRVILNVIRCESHYEVLLTSLKKQINK
jgi:poly-gamma-glutamate capsule biosynthesis protein CapA/YwtB (metallophosphatase superfamily)